MYFVYILYSSTSDIYYVGQTQDIDLRMEQHNNSEETSFTSKHRPWVLKKSIEVKTRKEAMKLERYIKKRKSKKYIEQLIKYESVVTELLKNQLSL